MAHFQAGDTANFTRNSVMSKSNVVIVKAVVHKDEVNYLIEHELGWVGAEPFVKKHSLDPLKTYLFVAESELSAIV